MIRVYLFSFFILISHLPLFAYTDPVLKVLIFHSVKDVTVSSTSRMSISGQELYSDSYSFRIRRNSKSSLYINNQLVSSKSITILPRTVFQINLHGSSFIRRYKGHLEVVPTDSGFYIINHIPVESYLEGVLNAEISTDWPIEAVKAQSVIARTFALYKKEKRSKKLWHLSSGQADQVYKGVNISDERGEFAIRQTRGIVVEYQGKLAQTFYHSNCGGITEDPSAIWNYSMPYLQVKSVPYGMADPRFNWQVRFSERELINVLAKSGVRTDRIQTISVLDYTSSGRANQLQINNSPDLLIPAATFRKNVGYQRLQM